MSWEIETRHDYYCLWEQSVCLRKISDAEADDVVVRHQSARRKEVQRRVDKSETGCCVFQEGFLLDYGDQNGPRFLD